MATFKAKVRLDQKRKDGTLKVLIQVVHNRTNTTMKNCWYATDSDIRKDGSIKNAKLRLAIDAYILSMMQKCNENASLIQGMSVKQLVDFLEHKEEDFHLDFFAYVDEKANELSPGTASLRLCAKRSLQEYLDKTHLDINEITTTMLNGWMNWIVNKPARPGRKKGTRAPSMYKQQLQVVFGQAKKEFNDEDSGIINIPRNPFANVIVPKWEEPVKRAISVATLRKIIALPYEKEVKNKVSRFNLAKDVYIISFMLCGMNAVDLFYCDCIKGNKITYERTKTRTRRSDNARIELTIQKELKPLMDKYGGGSVGRVFRFSKMYSSVDNFSAALGHGLKDIADKLGVPRFQFYSARHTWATLAVNEVGIDKYTVHQALNHVDDKLSVTDIYIKKDWKVVDKANRKVINYVLKKKIPSSQTGKSSTTKNKK